MSLRRGFKTNANRISLRLRDSFGLRAHDPIDLAAIAARLKIPIVRLSELAGDCPAEVHHLSITDRGAFSAVTLSLPDRRRVIVYNDTHDPGRQRSSIAHELAHLLLGHVATLPIDASGVRTIDRDIEDEANWLGATILISDAAALHIVRQGMDTETACRIYGVSEALLRMRINASGARARVERAYH